MTEKVLGENKVFRKYGSYVLIFFLLLFIAMTWRFWQFEVIGYQLDAEVGEFGRVDTYLTTQLVEGQTKVGTLNALEPIPHEISDKFALHYAPSDTAECYRVDFPRWLIVYRVELSRTICFDGNGLLNYTEVHTS